MARRNAPRETVEMPARLTPAMRRAWRQAQGGVTDETMDDVWRALLRFAARRTDGDAPRRH